MEREWAVVTSCYLATCFCWQFSSPVFHPDWSLIVLCHSQRENRAVLCLGWEALAKTVFSHANLLSNLLENSGLYRWAFKMLCSALPCWLVVMVVILFVLHWRSPSIFLLKVHRKPCLDLFPHDKLQVPTPCSLRFLSRGTHNWTAMTYYALPCPSLDFGFLRSRELCLVLHCVPKLCLEHSDLSLNICFLIGVGCLTWKTPVFTYIFLVVWFHLECCVFCSPC